MSKQSKFGFKIKLTSETSEKLRQEVLDSEAKPPELIEISECGNSVVSEPKITNAKIIEPEVVLSDTRDSHTELAVADQIPLVLKSADIGTKKSVPNDLDKKDGMSEVDTKDENAKESTADSFEGHAQHIHYEGDIAIYTDPSTTVKYVWCPTKNEWIPKTEPENQEYKTDNVTYMNGVATYTDKDGTVFTWDEQKSAWFPKVDEDFLAQYQMSYGFVDNTAESSTTKEKEIEEAEIKKEEQGIKRKQQEPPKWFEIADDQNTSVYVSNLPLDVTEEEFVELMQKCGLVMMDPTSHKMKVKLYTKTNSKQLKGDALCTYIKRESVELALNILDGYTYKNHRIAVEKAHFEMKGDYNPSLKPKKKKRKEKEKIKKMQEKLFDWRPEKFVGERSKHEKVVIIKNLFEPQLFDKEVHLILEYQEDLREECSKLGEVKKVFLYDRHPEGVAQISMNTPEEADKVVQVMNGRWFGKRQLTAEIWDGKTKYKMEETDADLNKRLGNWESFLEEKDKVKSGT